MTATTTPFDQPRRGTAGTLIAARDPGTSRAGTGRSTVDGNDQRVADRPSADRRSPTCCDRRPADGQASRGTARSSASYRVTVSPVGRRGRAAGLERRRRRSSQLICGRCCSAGSASPRRRSSGTVVVRRQLRPLREVAATAHSVAEMPLAERRDRARAERVPEHLTDERTEVGQVGAALNTLLVHVESSLHARHESEQQVRQFVADASHELRTPLTTIAGYTELARRRPEDTGAVTTALGKVEEESSRMTAMVEDLLLLARLDAGRPLAREPVDLSRLLVEAVSDARVVAPDHRWRLDLPEESIEVTGDVQRLHQVVTNLLTNARKYTPRRHHGDRHRHGRTASRSHDDGPGFPPGLAEKAFERFVRGDASRTRTRGWRRPRPRPRGRDRLRPRRLGLPRLPPRLHHDHGLPAGIGRRSFHRRSIGGRGGSASAGGHGEAMTSETSARARDSHTTDRPRPTRAFTRRGHQAAGVARIGSTCRPTARPSPSARWRPGRRRWRDGWQRST